MSHEADHGAGSTGSDGRLLWGERTREEFAALADGRAVVLVPVGATEQHGLHLPVDVDCRTAWNAALGAARLASAPVLVTPALWATISPHHMPFAGTISLTLETFCRLLGDLCTSITAHGFERILFVNGHGGNRDALGAATLELRHRLQRQIHAVSWFDLVRDVMDDLREGPGDDIGHSGELETSVVLHLAPQTVRADREELVEGITDDPKRATPEKGATLMSAACERLAALVADLHGRPGREITGIEMVER